MAWTTHLAARITEHWTHLRAWAAGPFLPEFEVPPLISDEDDLDCDFMRFLPYFF